MSMALQLNGVDWVEAISPVLLGGRDRSGPRIVTHAAIPRRAGRVRNRSTRSDVPAWRGSARRPIGMKIVIHYQDAALGRVIYPLRALRRRPIIDFDLMFGEVIARRKPLSWEAFSAGPDFSALAMSLETGSLAVLHSFTDLDELMLAVRASASVPFMCGHPVPSAVSGWPMVA
jgi:hypothetical protein